MVGNSLTVQNGNKDCMLYDGTERSHIITKAATKKSDKKKYHSGTGTLVSREHNINTYMEGSF